MATTGDFRDSDAAVVNLLRGDVSLGIGDLAGRLGVTATAVRQRLDRLMRAGLVERRAVSKPRGRPAHFYSLTDSGRRLGGDNFRDLAMVLWREVRGVPDHDVRRGLLARIAGGLADSCRGRVVAAGAHHLFLPVSRSGGAGPRDLRDRTADDPGTRGDGRPALRVPPRRCLLLPVHGRWLGFRRRAVGGRRGASRA